ncbi:50S ribosomal protein L10 [Aceticella autotrophica]|uniref:Large ribosomal subunit protein uL10 n=1 Tax=Aceticella autotrophica TaxID=2755338 RepID=A0A975AVF3_9THEO|nr:50S ribosomal protein L10 [Aceticella autotrophica]QSZ27168.1 50S ribosomal protein L10 [Aceticella autotrophica]
MGAAKEAKEKVVKEFKEKLSKSQSVIFTNYSGLTVENDMNLRRKFKESNAEYKVYKNTLMALAVKELGYDEAIKYLEGPTSVAFGYGDPVTPAKIIVEFSKDNKGIEFKAGIVDGKVIGPEEVKKLSELPSREELVAKALGSMKAPINNFVFVLSGMLRGLVVALNAVKEKKENEA